MNSQILAQSTLPATQHSSWNRQQIDTVANLYYGDLVAYVRRLTARCARRDPALHDADDIVHDYFVAALEKGWLDRDPAEINELRAYVLTQLRRFTWRAIGARHILAIVNQMDPNGIGAPDPDPTPAAIDLAALRELIEAALEELQSSNPLHARVMDDYISHGGRTSNTLRQELARTPAALDQLRHRARQNLRATVLRILDQRRSKDSDAGLGGYLQEMRESA